MHKATKLFKALKEGLVSFDGAHDIYTPQVLVEEILSKIHLNGDILVMFNIEFVISLVYTYNIDPGTITFYSDHQNKSEMARRLGVKYVITTLETDMKFDVIVGNPPYNDAVGTNREESKNTNNSNLYFDFILKSISLAPTGTISFVVPSAWMTNDRVKNKMMAAGLKSIMSVDPTYFPNVGIRSGITTFQLEHGYSGNIDIANESVKYSIKRSGALSFENPKKYDIIEKLKSVDNLGVHLKLGNYVVKKGTKGSIDRLLQNDSTYSDTKSKTHATQVLIYCGGIKKAAEYVYSSVKQAGRRPALAIPNASDKFILGAVRFIPKGVGISDRHKAVYFNTDAEAVNAQEYLTSKLIKFVIGTTKHNDTVNTNKNSFGHIPMIDFCKKWTDQDLYNYFNLSQDEIDYVEANVK
jgi:site-specific DNA-methyltransferase (adenine-specific)